MAVKAFVFLRGADYHPDYGVRFLLDLQNCEGNYAVAAGIYFESGLTPSAGAVAMNAAIAAFVRAYAETNWSTEFGMLDNVKVMVQVDGLLA